MCRNFVIALLVMGLNAVAAPPPLRLTIDCGLAGQDSTPSIKSRSSHISRRFDVNTFCNLIHNAIPKAVQDNKFLVIEDSDQTGFSNDQIAIAVPPPKGFIPKLGLKFKRPGVRVPKFNVPVLRSFNRPAPRVGSPKIRYIASSRDAAEEQSSAEKMEKFKKALQKMLHVVKVLGQIDQYVSDRTRIIFEKLTKAIAE